MVPNMKVIVNMSPHSLNTIIESYVDLNFMLAIVLDNSGEEKRVSQPSSSI